MSSSESSLSSFSSRLSETRRRACDETALNSTTFAIPLDSYFADREDDVALTLMTIVRATESILAEASHCNLDAHNSPLLRRIVYQTNKVKSLSITSLQDRGLHDAVKEITESLEKFGGYPPPSLEEVELINSGEPPSEPITPKEEEFPLPIPPPRSPSATSTRISTESSLTSSSTSTTPSPPQMAIRSAGKPRSARKQKRSSVSFAVGLPHYYSKASQTFKRDSPPSPETTLVENLPTPHPEVGINIPDNFHPDSRASSEEHFTDRCGRNDEYLICRYCHKEGHRQVNCLRYHCRICSNTAPGHLTAFCPYLSGRKIIKAKPRSWDFYDQLKKYEDLRDKEMEEIENSYHAERQYDDIEYEDLNYDHNLYDNTDN